MAHNEEWVTFIAYKIDIENINSYNCIFIAKIEIHVQATDRNIYVRPALNVCFLVFKGSVFENNVQIAKLIVSTYQ